MSDPVLVGLAVILGAAGGIILGLTIAGARLKAAVIFLEELLGLLQAERERLETLLGELEPEQQERRPPASNQ